MLRRSGPPSSLDADPDPKSAGADVGGVAPAPLLQGPHPRVGVLSCALRGEDVSPSNLADPRTSGLDLKASTLLRTSHLAAWAFGHCNVLRAHSALAQHVRRNLVTLILGRSATTTHRSLWSIRGSGGACRGLAGTPSSGRTQLSSPAAPRRASPGAPVRLAVDQRARRRRGSAGSRTRRSGRRARSRGASGREQLGAGNGRLVRALDREGRLTHEQVWGHRRYPGRRTSSSGVAATPDVATSLGARSLSAAKVAEGRGDLRDLPGVLRSLEVV